MNQFDGIDFNVPFQTAKDSEYMLQALAARRISGGGPFTARAEKLLVAITGARRVLLTTSCTHALEMAALLYDIEPGDEVILPSFTFTSTANAFALRGAKIVFADSRQDTLNIDEKQIERLVSKKTKVIVPVHYAGLACDMDALLAIARRHGVALIEDCSQAHLTTYRGKLCGTIGDIGAFSLQQSKHLTTGDGGVTITSDDTLWERMRFFVDKGWARREWGPRTYIFLAPNYRMTELQGAVGVAQTEKVQAVVDRRHHLGDLISTLIQGQEGITPAPVTPGGRHTYWLYPLRVDAVPAAEFAKALTAEGVPAGAGYIQQPIYMCAEALANKVTFGTSHVPFIPAFTDRTIEYGPGLCPHTEEALAHMVTIGINENFSDEDVHDIARAILKVAQGMLVAR